MTRRLSDVWSWGARIGTSLADQGLVSATAFLLHLGLARLLEPADYGSFAIGYTLLVMVMGFHATMVTEPMTVLGAARYRDRRTGYLQVVGRIHTLLAGGVALASAVVALVILPLYPEVARSLGAVALATPAFLTFLLVRRIAYLEGRARLALAGSTAYALVLLLGGCLLFAWEIVSPVTAYLLIGFASLAGCLPGWRSALRGRSGGELAPDRREVGREHWAYGKWILLGGLAHWGGQGIFVPVLGFAGGLAEAGAFRALSNLIAPVQQILVAVGVLLLPHIAGRRARSVGRPVEDLWWLGGITGPFGLAFGALLLVWGGDLLDLLYDQSLYSAYRHVLPGLALYALLLVASNAMTLVLRAVEDTRSTWVAKTAGGVVALGVGVPAILWLGTPGAVAGLVAVAAVESLVLAVYFPWRRSS